MSHIVWQSDLNALVAGASFEFSKGGVTVRYVIASANLDDGHLITKDGTEFFYDKETNALQLKGDSNKEMIGCHTAVHSRH